MRVLKFATLLFLIFSMLTGLNPSSAGGMDHSQDTYNNSEIYYNDILSGNVYIASVEELKEMGYDDEVIRFQSGILQSLPVVVKISNDELVSSQAKLTNRYRFESLRADYGVLAASQDPSSLRLTYQIRNTSGQTFQFRQKGIFDVNVPSAKTVSPGFGKGRVMYRSLTSSAPTAKVWTVWRENTNEEFSMPYKPYYSSKIYPTIEKIERFSLAQ